MKPEIIVALDNFKSKTDLEKFIEITKECDIIYKVGKESHIKYGDDLLNTLKDLRVFLDLKLHDIPNTVAKAVDAIIDRGVWMTNLHCSGGQKMMDAAAEMVVKRNSELVLIGVTILTSMDENDFEVFGMHSIILDRVVENMARTAQFSGLDGIVCSPLEVERIKNEMSDSFITVTPGVRWNPNDMTKPYESGSDDQKRVMTPLEAQKVGSDFLVIGRPITQASDPVEVIKNLKNTLGG